MNSLIEERIVLFSEETDWPALMQVNKMFYKAVKEAIENIPYDLDIAPRFIMLNRIFGVRKILQEMLKIISEPDAISKLYPIYNHSSTLDMLFYSIKHNNNKFYMRFLIRSLKEHKTVLSKFVTKNKESVTFAFLLEHKVIDITETVWYACYYNWNVVMIYLAQKGHSSEKCGCCGRSYAKHRVREDKLTSGEQYILGWVY